MADIYFRNLNATSEEISPEVSARTGVNNFGSLFSNCQKRDGLVSFAWIADVTVELFYTADRDSQGEIHVGRSQQLRCERQISVLTIERKLGMSS